MDEDGSITTTTTMARTTKLKGEDRSSLISFTSTCRKRLIRNPIIKDETLKIQLRGITGSERLGLILVYADETDVAKERNEWLEIDKDVRKIQEEEGVIEYKVVPKVTTYGHRGKMFKFVVREKSSGETKHIVLDLPAFKIFETKFVCTKEPKSVWFKSVGKKEESSLEVRTEVHGVSGGRVRTKYSLRYADDLDECPDQSLLNIVKETRQAINVPNFGFVVVTETRFRIEAVSSRHQHRRFVLQIDPDPSYPLTVDQVGWVRTIPVQVLSKRSNGKRKRSVRAAATTPDTGTIGEGLKREMFESSRLALDQFERDKRMVASWCKHARELLNLLQYTKMGVALSEDGTKANMGWQLFRCPSCFAYRDNVRGAQPHRKECVLRTLLDLHDRHIDTALQELAHQKRRDSPELPASLPVLFRDNSLVLPSQRERTDSFLMDFADMRDDRESEFNEASMSSDFVDGIAGLPSPPSMRTNHRSFDEFDARSASIFDRTNPANFDE